MPDDQTRYYELKAGVEEDLATDLQRRIGEMTLAMERHRHRAEVFHDMARIVIVYREP